MRRRYHELKPGDVFSIPHERDKRRYMKLGDFGAVDVETQQDAIPALNDRCFYHYSIDVHNNMYKRSDV